MGLIVKVYSERGSGVTVKFHYSLRQIHCWSLSGDLHKTINRRGYNVKIVMETVCMEIVTHLSNIRITSTVVERVRHNI